MGVLHPHAAPARARNSITRAWSPPHGTFGATAGDTSPSGEGVDAGQRLAEDERVDLAGALVGEHRLEVVHVADHRVLERHAVGAENGPGAAGDPQRLADVVEL